MLFAPTAVLAFAATLFAGVNAVDADHGEEAATEMGPAAFLWPSDRVWGAAADNTAPCGSVAGVTNRTDFPLGRLCLVRIWRQNDVLTRCSSQRSSRYRLAR